MAGGATDAAHPSTAADARPGTKSVSACTAPGTTAPTPRGFVRFPGGPSPFPPARPRTTACDPEAFGRCCLKGPHSPRRVRANRRRTCSTPWGPGGSTVRLNDFCFGKTTGLQCCPTREAASPRTATTAFEFSLSCRSQSKRVCGNECSHCSGTSSRKPRPPKHSESTCVSQPTLGRMQRTSL